MKALVKDKDGEAWGAELPKYVRKRLVAQGDPWSVRMHGPTATFDYRIIILHQIHTHTTLAKSAHDLTHWATHSIVIARNNTVQVTLIAYHRRKDLVLLNKSMS